MTIEEAPGWARRLKGELHKAAERGCYGAAVKLQQRVLELIGQEPRIPVDRGIYRGGWRVRRVRNGAELTNSVPHAAFIEDGVRGENVKISRAMIDALAAWVVRKGLTGSAKKEERTAEGRGIAWAIAKSMQKKGIFNAGGGLKILKRAVESAPKFLEEEIHAEIGRMPL